MVVCRTTLSDPLRCAAVQSPTIRSPLWEKFNKMCTKKKGGGLKKKHKVALLGLIGWYGPLNNTNDTWLRRAETETNGPKPGPVTACPNPWTSRKGLRQSWHPFSLSWLGPTWENIVFQTNGHRCEDLSPPWLYLSTGTFGKLGTEGGQVPEAYLS